MNDCANCTADLRNHTPDELATCQREHTSALAEMGF